MSARWRRGRGSRRRRYSKIWARARAQAASDQDLQALARSSDFVAKVEDVVGLYLNPPDKALVLAVDEKSQIQALDRTQPGLPMKKGRCGTMTHDYKRNGTTTLFAALNTLDWHGHRPTACSAIGIASFSASCKTIDATDASRISTCISSSTTMPLTRPPPVKALAQAAFAISSALHAHIGLVAQSWSSGSSPKSPKSASAAAPSRASTNLRASHHGLPRTTTTADPKPYVWTKTAGRHLQKSRPCETSVGITTLAGC